VTTECPLITYIRVSTSQQGARAGLGLRRQTLANRQSRRFHGDREFVEVETGKGSDALDRRTAQGRIGCGSEAPMHVAWPSSTA